MTVIVASFVPRLIAARNVRASDGSKQSGGSCAQMRPRLSCDVTLMCSARSVPVFCSRYVSPP
jgi:hypothetical protein